jgi:predicted MFS family arabinose efflux permease
LLERTKTKKAIASLVASRIIYATNWLNIGAIFVLMEATLNVGIVGLGTLTSSFYLGLGLTQVPAGILAAELGPKKVVVAGIMLSSLTTLGISASKQLIEVAVLRFVVGAGMACVFAPAVVLVAKYFGGNRSGVGVGVYNSAFDIGGLLGLYVWVIIASAAGWQSSLLLSGGLGVITGVLVAYYVPDDSTSLEFKIRLTTLWSILKDRQLVLLGLGTLGLNIGNILISSFMVYYLNKSLGVPLPTAGLVAAMIVVVPIVTALWGGRLYDRIGKPRLLTLLSGLGMVVALLLTSIPSLAVAVVSSVIGGAVTGIGFTASFAWARDLNTAEQQYDGLAIAWVNGISLTGAFVPPLVFSRIVGGWGYSAAWLAGAAMCLALTASLLFQEEGIPARAARA